MQSNCSGFTLVELLVAIALVSLVILVAGSVTVTLYRSTLTSRLITKQQDAMFEVMTQITAQLREAIMIDCADFRLPDQESRPELSQATNPTAAVIVTLPPALPDASPRYFQFGYRASNGTVWLGENEHSACAHIAEFSILYDFSQCMVTIRIVSRTDLPGVQQGLPIILETSAVLRNAGLTFGG